MGMNKFRMYGALLLALMVATLAAPSLAAQGEFAGALYTATNDVSANRIVQFARSSDGGLTFAGMFATGGRGTGTGLGNQSGLALSPNGRWLLAVNAGSDDVSVFAVQPHGLRLVHRAPSGGRRPVSVTIRRNLVYVLSAGGAVGDADNISGFRLSRRGELAALPNSTRPLSGVSTAPAQVQFSPDGDVLVVTEKATNIIDTYTVGDDGLATGPNSIPSPGATPFGFAFGKRDQLFVSEAFGGAANASTVSSFSLAEDGALSVISPSVATTESAACWVVITSNGRFAYTTNTASGTVSGFRVAFDGTLTLLQPDGVSGQTGSGSGPIDMALSQNSRFLFTLNSGNGTISAFRVQPNGNLTPLAGMGGLPLSSNGLVAR